MRDFFETGGVELPAANDGDETPGVAPDFGVAGDFEKYLNRVLLELAAPPPKLFRLDISQAACFLTNFTNVSTKYQNNNKKYNKGIYHYFSALLNERNRKVRQIVK